MKQFFLGIIFLSFLGFFPQPAHAQYKKSWSSGEIREAIRKLNVLGTVLYIAAHPDDENTRLITWLSRERLYRTGYLSLTRGDGGQNLIGEEQGVELGLIRTQELLAARRIDGGEQFFSRAFDFGYSKTPEETLEKWGREKILHDVVWIIRKFQPDIIITRFPTTGEGGHGHHTSSAILANEAYEAAADPKRFPEQLKYVETWQVKRVLWNTFNFGTVNTINENQFRVDVGGYNPSLGASYGEIAANSRSQHKSQGFGMPAQRGESYEYFSTTKGPAPETDLMDGVVTGWRRIKGAREIPGMIEQVEKEYDPLSPQNSVDALVGLYKKINTLPDQYWKRHKLKEVEELILQCAGFYAEAFTRVPAVAPSDSLQIHFSVISRLSPQVSLEKAVVDGNGISINKSLAVNKAIDWSHKLRVPSDRPFTQPYWLSSPMEEGSFVVDDITKIGQPDVDPAWSVDFTVKVNDLVFTINRPVLYKYTDPVKGELYQPLAVLPAMELKFAKDNFLLRNDSTVSVRVQFKSNRKDSINYQVRFVHSKRWNSTRPEFVYSGHPGNEVVSVYRRLDKSLAPLRERISLEATDREGRKYSHYRREIRYDHIPHIIYFPRAEANLLGMQLATGGKRIGYIPGAGDKVPEALEEMGYEVVMLTNKELSRNHLGQFDAIITGVRAYNTNEWMNDYYSKLMQYVQDGGRLIVQYNTSSNIGPVRARIAPYQFEISRTRVTDEKAKVSILKANDVLFNNPNKITEADFEGWVQERSIYHASGWDKEHFQSLISMADPNEKADEGALIRAKYGKGEFIYTGLVFFRQLPAGVPGAYRLFANLIESK